MILTRSRLGLLAVIFCLFVTELWPLIHVRILFPLNLFNKWIEFHQILYVFIRWYWQYLGWNCYRSVIFCLFVTELWILFLLKGIYLIKFLLVWFFSCINKNCFSCYQGDRSIWPHCCMNNLKSHKDHFTPQHTAFKQSAACLSVFLELLPGLIPFAILWHTGWILEICMNMNYKYLTTIYTRFKLVCVAA